MRENQAAPEPPVAPKRVEIDATLPTGLYEAVDDLWIVTAYFNPAGYRTRRANHDLFAQRIVESGLRLLTVECALGEAAFELPESPDVLRVRARTVLWHKERLLNLGIARLPPECTKVAWLDGDILFDNPAWAVETSRLLDDHAVVQPFVCPLRMLEGGRRARDPHRRGFAVSRAARSHLGRIRDRRGCTARPGSRGRPQRRVIADAGLYDAMVAGGGDHVMAHAFGGGWSSVCIDVILGPDSAYRRHAQAWIARLPADALGSMAFVEGTAFHLWHGKPEHRAYKARHEELRRFDYDPATDIRPGPGGCWEWASAKPELHSLGRRILRASPGGRHARRRRRAVGPTPPPRRFLRAS